MIRLRILAVFITAAMLAASLVAYQSTQAATQQAATKVTIQNFAFSPTTLTVPVGTTVTWTNADSTEHTVTSNTGAWADSGPIEPSHTFSHTFTKPGTFAYHCEIHPFMTAKIIVTGTSTGTSKVAGSAAPVKMAAANILVTATGMTLYVFAKDSKGTSACYQGCATIWPPLTVAKGSTVASSVSGIVGTFGVINRTDGTTQLTYDAAPLYTFSHDKKPGDMNGQGIAGIWWAVVAPAATTNAQPAGHPAAVSPTVTSVPPAATSTSVPPVQPTLPPATPGATATTASGY